MPSEMTIQRIKDLFLSPRFWLGLAVVVFLCQAAVYPFVLKTHADEGTYSYLGLNVVEGVYSMYREGDPWFPHMPLSYLVPGVIHKFFGKDLCVYRLFCALWTGLLIACVYYVSLRLGGRWSAIVSIWLLVASIQTMRLYMIGGPLSFAVLFLMMSLAALVSDIKSPYREVLAVMCVSVALMTRQNMLLSWLVVVAFCLYVQRRWIDRAIILIASLSVPTIVAYPFFPDISAQLLHHPLIPSWIARVVLGHVVPESSISPVGSLRVYIGVIYYLITYYFLLISVLLAVAVWAAVQGLKDSRYMKSFVPHKPKLALTVLLLLINLMAHIIGPMLTKHPFAIYNYFNYCASLAAVVGGVGLASMLGSERPGYFRGLVTGCLGMATFLSLSTLMPSSQFILAPSSLANVRAAAQELASLTTPEDKIFSFTLTHEFHLSGRRPFPGLVWNEWALVLTPDTQVALKFHRYNYALASRWMAEADVVVVSDVLREGLMKQYPGCEGSGRDVVNMVDSILSSRFRLIAEIPATSWGSWRIYRKLWGHAPEEGS